MHVVRLADVVAGVRRTSKKRRGGRIDIRAAGVNTEKSCFPKGEEKQGPESDSDRDTDAATADCARRRTTKKQPRRDSSLGAGVAFVHTRTSTDACLYV